jgi:hypothetical protein
MTLGVIRATVCFCLFSVLGIFYPALKTARALRDDDNDQMKEQLTYWTITALLGLIELACAILGVYQTTPPELRILLVLWLTQPQWGGCHQIYSILIQVTIIAIIDHKDIHIMHFPDACYILNSLSSSAMKTKSINL